MIKTYDVKKIKDGYQVIWYYGGYKTNGYLSSENYVNNGFFKNLDDAQNFANELEFFGEGDK